MSANLINDVVMARQIREVVHFTSNNGLVGSLQMGALLSRRALPNEKHLAYVAAPTAAERAEASEFFDKARDWLDYVNLSISEINTSYFRFANKWHAATPRWWTILSFDPVILQHADVHFSTTNNVYPLVRRGEGVSGLNALFDDPIGRKPGWTAHRRSRQACLPTCEQAEVLYPARLSLEHLRKVYVRGGEEHDVVCGWLDLYHRNNVEVVIDADKFLGAPN